MNINDIFHCIGRAPPPAQVAAAVTVAVEKLSSPGKAHKSSETFVIVGVTAAKETITNLFVRGDYWLLWREKEELILTFR